MTKQTRRIFMPFLQLFGIAAVFLPALGNAGSYIFAGEGNGLDVVTHPSGYTGAGGVLNVEVCIASTAVDAAAMEISIQNNIKEINSMTASTPNLLFGGNNNIPGNKVDFQSVALHELLHCTGLGHVNLGVQTGVSGANTEFTQSGDGANNTFSLNSGVDTVIGSSDDQRDDDQNLHWFEKNVNNPFLETANPQSSNYSRDLADLPIGHDFATNAGRGVGTFLGVADTEAVMQQGTGFDEDQRSLQADDVTTYRMAMTGLDEIASTADDYTINMVYGGIKVDTSGCDIVVESELSGFARCTVGGSFFGASHLVITVATVKYNSDYASWFFNTVPNSSCSAGSDDLTFSNVNHSNTQNHEACVSITYGPNYQVGASGDVTATAPMITLGPGTTINGTFTAYSSVP